VGESVKTFANSKFEKIVIISGSFGGVLVVGLLATRGWVDRHRIGGLNAAMPSYRSAVQKGEIIVE
jgi:hypothetical protein